MMNIEEASSGSFPTLHEYPDPDYAAHVTQYPWAGQSDERESLGEQFHAEWSRSDHLSRHSNERHVEEYDTGYFDPKQGVILDPDYEVSDDPISADENVSDDDLTPSTYPSPTIDDLRRIGSVTSNYEHYTIAATVSKTKGSRGKARRRGYGRGGAKGVKKGPRRAMEPNDEFKSLHSQATMAFVEHDYDEAERLTLQAILINPEMYPAHNLLAQIHTARGDDDKAISAQWAAAHTKHRDPEIWSRTARLILERNTEDRNSSLRGAIYCINRIISLDKHNVEARFQRATLYHELGHNGKAAAEYEQLIKHLPHDTTILRHLAEIYIETGQPERVLPHYQESISHFQETEPDIVASFTWSDVNIITELYGLQQKYDEGILQLKSLARWLLGRRRDTYWETFSQDDREWDLDDEPRRNELADYEPGQFDLNTYGYGLPLELRVKIGVFRLKSQSYDLKEAINHFEWLNPEDNEIGANLFDYPDLFREAATALRDMEFYHEALRYYEPLQQIADYADLVYLFEIASCYRAVGLIDQADHCYKSILNLDKENHEARIGLSNARKSQASDLFAYLKGNQIDSVQQRKGARNPAGRGRRNASDTLMLGSAEALLAPRLAQQSSKRKVADKSQIPEAEVHDIFLHQQNLSKRASGNDKAYTMEWMSATDSLLHAFRSNKLFYPVDKHHRFLGYSKVARLLATRPKHELETLIHRSDSILETLEGDQIIIPDEYCGVHFNIWLDMFLEYAIAVAKIGDVDSAYEIVKSAFHANVFYHSPDSVFLIHVCWFACALIGNDDETLCNTARWFMKEYQFVTDGYRLFSLLNRLCDSEGSWFNCGPSQKYILRQLKAVDFSLLGDARRRSLFQERASYTTRDDDGRRIQAEDMDVALLMLYGHILHAGKSYSYAINYYLRALALDPCNPMIKLSLALGYLHYSLKRQVDNRQQVLIQGLAFLMEYYDDRSHSADLTQVQEAEYNVAHAYHVLGLTHLAIPYYERCLDLTAAVRTQLHRSALDEFSREAALNFQTIVAANGDSKSAQDITETWLVM